MMISRTSSSSHRSDLMAAQPPPQAKKPSSSSSVSAPTSSSEKRAKTTQSTLHDFSSFPVLKTWGFQRVLRCVKVDSSNNNNAASDRASAGEEKKNEKKKKKKKKKSTDSEDEIDQIRARSRKKIKPFVQEKQEPGSAEKEVPWNLRTRRGCYTRPTGGRNPNSEDEGVYAGCSMRRRSEEDSEDQRSGRNKKKTRFSVVLTKQEIEEDLYSMTGKRASKRPKKRPRALKNQLDQLYPGVYMSEATPALYEVREPAAKVPE